MRWTDSFWLPTLRVITLSQLHPHNGSDKYQRGPRCAPTRLPQGIKHSSCTAFLPAKTTACATIRGCVIPFDFSLNPAGPVCVFEANYVSAQTHTDHLTDRATDGQRRMEKENRAVRTGRLRRSVLLTFPFLLLLLFRQFVILMYCIKAKVFFRWCRSGAHWGHGFCVALCLRNNNNFKNPLFE